MYPEKHVLRHSPPVLVVKLLVGYNQYVETETLVFSEKKKQNTQETFIKP